jgi:hypothetical protein
MEMMRRILTRLSALLPLALAGCVTMNSVTPGGEAALLDEVRAGTAELDCGIACMPLFAYQQRKLEQLAREQNWPELALTTAKTSYRRDITYFYLGLAAEGMQAWAAADRYYRMAGALATGKDSTGKCASVKNMCAGFKFPQDIVARLRGVSAKLGRAPVSAQELQTVGTELRRPGEDDFMPEAPQVLLEQYAARRLIAGGSGQGARDQAFHNQLLEIMEPVRAHVERGVASIWNSSVQRLNQRLVTQPEEPRMTLGMWVQLAEYDRASQSFGVRYPLFSANQPPLLTNDIYRGESPRKGPNRDYSQRGTTCVWENRGNQPRYLSPDAPQPYFLVLTLCQQRPTQPWRNAAITANNAELPPLTQLTLPEGGLWPRVNMSQARADQLLRSVGPQRLVWAELVFDLRAVGSLDRGPFLAQDTLGKMRTGMVAAIMPRALFLWQTAPEPPKPGLMIGFAGDVVVGESVPRARLPRMLVADRSYDGLPVPVIANRAPAPPAGGRVTVLPSTDGSGVYVPSALHPAPLPGAPGAGRASTPPATATTRSSTAAPVPRPATSPTPSAPARANSAKDDDEDWVEPPPAKR